MPTEFLIKSMCPKTRKVSILKGLNNKTKLTIYKYFEEEVKFECYLHVVSAAGTCLLFKLHFGTHGLNEEFGRHRSGDV